jgi:hypothetical protein
MQPSCVGGSSSSDLDFHTTTVGVNRDCNCHPDYTNSWGNFPLDERTRLVMCDGLLEMVRILSSPCIRWMFIPTSSDSLGSFANIHLPVDDVAD